MRVVYWGGQCLLLETQRKRILINPGRKERSRDSVFPREEWKDIDLILASYDDPAYVGYLEEIARRSKTQILCQYELGRRLRLQSKGHLVGVIEGGKPKVLGGVKIEGMIPEPKDLPRRLPPPGVILQGPRAYARWRADEGGAGVAPIGFLFEIDRIKTAFLGGAMDPDLWSREEPALMFVSGGGPGVRFEPQKVLAVVQKLAPTHVFTYGYKSTVGARIFRRGELESFAEAVKGLKAIHHHLEPGKDFLYR